MNCAKCRYISIPIVIVVLQWLPTPLRADVIVYDDQENAFQWLPDYGSGDRTYFDPTQPATQSGERTESSLWYDDESPVTSTSIAVNSVNGTQQIEFAVGDPFTVYGIEGDDQEATPAAPYQPGESVGPDATWASSFDWGWYTSLEGRTFLLPDQPIIGFRTGSSGQYRYGWIALSPGEDVPYHPLRWAYETDVNTPIRVISEPASSGLIVLGLLVAACCRRMRRKGSA